jgi:uncharacterized protein (UPF0332 family)
MRTLTAKQKARAAECLAIAYSHYSAGLNLSKTGDYAFSVSKFYYAAVFAAQAACLELCRGSSKHKYWKGEFNKHFGKGRGWIPKSYPTMLNKLCDLREEADYKSTLPNDEILSHKYMTQVGNLLKKVRNNTPLLLYPEFIEDLVNNDGDILALEFDYYCPKSYIHKERVQFQIQADLYTHKTTKQVLKAAKDCIKTIKASRKDDYVLGWNNRLGQDATAFLLFLDIDENDETLIKSALKKRKGWLFKTGSGYHFIGYDIYSSTKQWLYRLNQAVKSKQLKSIIDIKHVEFSEKRGYATLRIGSSPIKNFTPFMCWDNSK